MQFALGALSVIVIVLTTALAVVWKKFNLLNRNIDFLTELVRNVHEDVSRRFNAVQKVVSTIPRSTGGSITQNIIHLGLKDGRVTTDLPPAVRLAIDPNTFRIDADKLFALAISNLERLQESHTNNPDTVACCLLEYTGLSSWLDVHSKIEFRSAFMRLLVNHNDEATRTFLRTVVDSVCSQAGPTPEPAPATGKPADDPTFDRLAG
jgi:hypothetical protein